MREVNTHNKWYDKPVWRRIRKMHLAAEPLCVLCGRAANTVDHKESFGDSWEMFTDMSNHQSMCHTCHSGRKQAIDKKGFSKACDKNGFPLDASHPFFRNS